MKSTEKEATVGDGISQWSSPSGHQLAGAKSASGGVGSEMPSRGKQWTSPKPKAPFHDPMIPRPQQEYRIKVDNSNQPFEHVWLNSSEDGSRFVHPLEKMSVSNFVDRNGGKGDPIKPLSVECTPFKLVDTVKGLKDLSAKLQHVNEFAVDLEHNKYRSFQGLTCLMQISTRTDDFIIDTLKVRMYVGPYLREVFKDPTKRKVMHGADCDILWLQRDFGIYVCNLFDTGQASRVMQLERNSLQYLLQHFCGVILNKEYQNTDWRLRPLPEEMLKYAREDTHYLLHLYDLMRNRLLQSCSPQSDLLLEVFMRSSEICMQLYEKELLTETSYLHTYGLQEADLDSQQLAIVYGLFAWRDMAAREEDESTGYILPNRTLLQIARQMPLSYGNLKQIVETKHPYILRHIHTVLAIIWSSLQNASSFESVSQQLKKQNHEVSGSASMHIAESPTVSFGAFVGNAPMVQGFHPASSGKRQQ